METVLEAIRAAVAPNATADAKTAGISACRAVLAALEATPGQALATATPPSSAVAALVASLRGVPMEQLLDLAIARLQTMLPSGTDVAKPRGFNFVRIPTPKG